MMNEENTYHENYLKYRGNCYEYCLKELEKDPTLTIVRGHYWCPMWNKEEPHWWCVKEDGTIVDPTKLQFPSAGNGEYIPFDGNVECAECGTQMKESEAYFYGNYAFCPDTNCCMSFIGLM